MSFASVAFIIVMLSIQLLGLSKPAIIDPSSSMAVSISTVTKELLVDREAMIFWSMACTDEESVSTTSSMKVDIRKRGDFTLYKPGLTGVNRRVKALA